MKRTLGLTSIFCISTGAMISSGLFVLPGLAFAKAGPAVFISYFLAGLVALTTVFSLSELITAMPKAGGDYFYVSRSFGPLFGTVSGLLSWLALSLKSAFAIIGIAELATLTFGLDLLLGSVILTLLFTLLNLLGVKEAVRFQVALVIALLIILFAFVVTGIPQVSIERFIPLTPNGGINSVISTAGFVFVSFGGVLTTASIAGEIRNPSQNIPRGLISSILAVTVLYSSVTFIVVSIVPSRELAQSLAPIALAGQKSGGFILYSVIMIGSLLAFITTANGGILTASRYPIALSTDGMLPTFFSRCSKKKNTPYGSVIATGILIGLSVLLKLDMLIKAASTVILLSNIFAHLSVIIMRESNISNYRPTYRAPLYPWLQILSIIAFALLIIDMGIEPILISLAFVSIAIIIFFLRRGNLEKVSPALVHLLERITNQQLATSGLKEELREIVEDRDGIVRDDFDHAMVESAFLDLEEVKTMEELWPQLSELIHQKILANFTEDEIEKMLRTRESQGSTALSHFVAIPHIIIPGTNTFKLLLVRSKSGIYYNSHHPSLRACFVMIGTKDQRNLHLRALAAIAQVAQHSQFEREWLSAKDHQEVIDLFILSKRQRQHFGSEED